MHKNFKILLLFLTICTIQFNANALISYKLIDLGLQESDRSEAYAVNDKGQVLGSYSILGNQYFFLWNEKEGLTLIDLPSSAATPLILNNEGQIAGNYYVGSSIRGFFWDSLHGFKDLGSLGGKNTYVTDMNDLGQIVGYSQTNIPNPAMCSHFNTAFGVNEVVAHGFLWKDNVMFDLGALTGDMGLKEGSSQAVGIDNNGLIIGHSTYIMVHKGNLMSSEARAVIWRNGKIDELEKNFKGKIIFNSINDNGIAIYNYLPENNQDAGVRIIDLNSMHSWRPNIGIGKLNNKMSVLGGNGLCNLKMNEKGEYIAHYTKSNEGIFRIDEIFNEIIINHPTWNKYELTRNFNNNNWVVGLASNIYNERHAFVLVPEIQE